MWLKEKSNLEFERLVLLMIYAPDDPILCRATSTLAEIIWEFGGRNEQLFYLEIRWLSGMPVVCQTCQWYGGKLLWKLGLRGDHKCWAGDLTFSGSVCIAGTDFPISFMDPE